MYTYNLYITISSQPPSCPTPDPPWHIDWEFNPLRVLAKRSGNAGHVGGACKSCEEHANHVRSTCLHLETLLFLGWSLVTRLLPPSPLRYTTPLSDKKPSRHSACISQLSTQTGEGIQGRPGNRSNMA